MLARLWKRLRGLWPWSKPEPEPDEDWRPLHERLPRAAESIRDEEDD